MSNYEDYSKVSDNYDRTRIPVGVEIITGCLAQSATPLAEQHILDAGCGTGNYSHAMLTHVDRISAVDLNPEMLERARHKCSRDRHLGRIDFYQSDIDSLPFEDAVFDGIMINQVLHHLELAENEDYPVYRRVFEELSRVLKPGGAVIVNTCSHKQLKNSFWYYQLIPEETDHMCERHISLGALQQVMHDAGVAYRACFVPVDALMQGEDYFNAHGPLDMNWRDGDSIWSTVSQSKMTDISARLIELEQSGELEQYMEEHDLSRQQIGQFSFLYGRKESD